MRTYSHISGRRVLEGLQNAGGISGMKTAGHVGTGHDVQHGGIVAHAPRAKAFTQIAVDVHLVSFPSISFH